MLDQFEYFFTNKEVVSISLYKSDTTTGLPVLYLQDHKKALWKKFHESYPNSIGCTAFMTRLEGGIFLYKDNLGRLYSDCNEFGYEVFSNIRILITAHVENESLQVWYW